jgi:hypothetical protein
VPPADDRGPARAVPAGDVLRDRLAGHVEIPADIERRAGPRIRPCFAGCSAPPGAVARPRPCHMSDLAFIVPRVGMLRCRIRPRRETDRRSRADRPPRGRISIS